MKNFKIEQIYGCSIEDYLQAHGKTKEDLFEDIETKINLLTLNKQRIAMTETKSDDDVALFAVVDELIQKKKAHLRELKSFLGGTHARA